MTVVAGSSGHVRRPDDEDAPDAPEAERPPRRDRTRTARLVVAGLVGALRAAVVGLVVALLVGLALLLSTGAGPGAGAVVGLGGSLWLAAHHVPVVVAGHALSLLPLGLLLLPAVLLARVGRTVAREVEIGGPRDAAVAVGALAVPYAVAGLVVALATLAGPQPADVGSAPVATFLFALVAGGYGVLRGSGLLRRAAARLAPGARATLVGGAGAVATLVATSGLLVTVLLAVHVIRVRDVTASLHATGAGGVALFLLGAVYVPNAVVLALGYAAGPGFTLGAGTLVAPWHVATGPVPAFPLLGAVPSGTPPLAAWLVLAGPVLAGVVAGTLLVRHTVPRSLPRAALTAVQCGPLAGLVVAVLTTLAGGALGTGRLAAVGAPVWPVAGAVAGEVAVGAVVAAVAATWRARRRRPAVPADDPPADDTPAHDTPADDPPAEDPPAGETRTGLARRTAASRVQQPGEPANDHVNVIIRKGEQDEDSPVSSLARKPKPPAE